MKKGLLIILFLGGILQGFAQTLTPEFEFQLYFEDAVGNRDTVTLGYDALATAGIDATFGEVNILNQPWENRLDVRITNKYWETIGMENSENLYNLKKQIISGSENRPISIDIRTEYWPIKVYWDSTNFNFIAERMGTFLTSIEYGTWFDLSQPDFLSSKNEVVYDSFPSSSFDNDHQVMSFYSVNSSNIYTLWFSFEDSTFLTVGLNDVETEKNIVYPNPFSGTFTISNLNDNNKVDIYDVLGREIEYERNGNVFTLHNSCEKIYLLNIDRNKSCLKLYKIK